MTKIQVLDLRIEQLHDEISVSAGIAFSCCSTSSSTSCGSTSTTTSTSC